jgi:hypothetical protein
MAEMMENDAKINDWKMMENDEKMMGKWSENEGKMMENDAKMMGKWWNNEGKWWKMIGNDGKLMKIDFCQWKWWVLQTEFVIKPSRTVI